MSIIFPGNEERAARLQQLIDDVASLQTQVAVLSQTMDKADVSMKANLDQLLQNNNMTTFDELEAQIMAEMTPEQQANYQQMVNFNKQFTTATDAILQATSIILGAAIISRLAIAANAYAHTVGLMRVAQGFARGFELLNTEGFSIALDYFRGFRVGLVGLSEEYAASSRLGRVLGTVGEVCEFLAYAGVAIDAIMLLVQAIEGGIQKQRMNDAIGKMQITRLSTAYFSNEATVMTAHIESLSDYMVLRVSSDSDDQKGAQALGHSIAMTIAADEAKITLAGVEEDLESQDSGRGSKTDFDISTDQVIAGAQVDPADPNPDSSTLAGSSTVTPPTSSATADPSAPNTAVPVTTSAAVT